MDAPRNAHSLALEQESRAWQILHGISRIDPQYPQALSDWQAAADRIGVEAEKLLKLHRQPRPASPGMAVPAMPLAPRPRTGAAFTAGRNASRDQHR